MSTTNRVFNARRSNEPTGKHWRKLVVEGVTYRYRVTQSGEVIVRWLGEVKGALTAQKRVTNVWNMRGQRFEDFERGQWKRTSDGVVTPKEIRELIWQDILRR